MTPQVGSSLVLRCEARGIPEPEVTWYRNGLQLAAGNGLRIERQKLEIVGVQVSKKSSRWSTSANYFKLAFYSHYFVGIEHIFNFFLGG